MRLPHGHASHVFSQVPQAQIPRSSFDRSHGYKTSFNPGYLIPIFVDEVLPGDTFNCSMTGFCRLSTPIKPIMDNAYFNTFFFFVPNRLVWDNWQKFNGEQKNPGDSTDYLVPQVESTSNTDGFAPGGVGDYMGLPSGPGSGAVDANAFYFRAYNLIWNEWFRDQNLQNSVPVPLTDGPDPETHYPLLRRGKRHDYFTSSLPWPQKGESVSIPLGVAAPVISDQEFGGTGVPSFFSTGLTGPSNIRTNGAGSQNVMWGTATTGTPQDAYWDFPALSADLSQATAATINQLRQAFAVQRLYERDARGGTRYTEIIRSHFGVTSPDARLQRPEYLGGGQSPVLVHQVAQTQQTDGAGTPQGNLAAYGTGVLNRHGFSKAFTEHGVIIGLLSVRADLNYQQGKNRMWSRRQRFDYYWPALSHIGEQAVLSKEIYHAGTSSDDDVWGYQERYAEYRYKPSQITGKLRSNDPQSLDVWHLAQDFGSRPYLNGTFIQDNPPFERVVAVPSEPIFIGDFHFNLRCARPMPVYGVPGMIDHF